MFEVLFIAHSTGQRISTSHLRATARKCIGPCVYAARAHICASMIGHRLSRVCACVYVCDLLKFKILGSSGASSMIQNQSKCACRFSIGRRHGRGRMPSGTGPELTAHPALRTPHMRPYACVRAHMRVAQGCTCLIEHAWYGLWCAHIRAQLCVCMSSHMLCTHACRVLELDISQRPRARRLLQDPRRVVPQWRQRVAQVNHLSFAR